VTKKPHLHVFRFPYLVSHGNFILAVVNLLVVIVS